MAKRILLITDSLGCPRAETPVENTWTEKILRYYTDDNDTHITSDTGGGYFYTYCEHGLSASWLKLDYIEEIKPDILIIQIGIVDACRRAFSRRFLRLIQITKILEKPINIIASRHHFLFTKLHNEHYCSIQLFKHRLESVAKAAKDVLFIPIAQPGKYLMDKTYNVVNDVNAYNEIIYEVADQYSCTVAEPYKDLADYLLDDGCHLNDKGILAVYETVLEYLDREL